MNTPNKLSLLRIILIPFFIFFYLYRALPNGILIATIILIVAELTDFLDGYLARKYNQITDLGKLLDPVADKSFSLSALILVAFDKIIPHPYGIIVVVIFLLRDFIVNALRQIGASKQVIISADKFGKLKSIALDLSLPILFFVAYQEFNLGITTGLLNVILTVLGLGLLAVATILTVYSGINYVIKNRDVLKETNKK